MQFETADDQDFIAVQNAIEEVISELRILPGLSSLEEVRVNAVTLMGGVWMKNCEQELQGVCKPVLIQVFT